MSDEQNEPDEQQADESGQEEQGEAENSQEESDERPWNPEAARKHIHKLTKENKSVRERASAAEKKAANIDEISSERDKLAATNMQLEVGYELGLPLSLAKRLQGATRDEMLADAEALVDLVAPKKPGTRRPTETLRGGLEPDAEPEETDLRKLGSRMFQR